MDLFDQLTEGREDRALDRLVAIMEPYSAANVLEQTLALERAMAYCEMEWGDYGAGMEALAARIEARGGGSESSVLEALRLREEGGNPGSLIQASRRQRERAGAAARDREAVIALYGSEDAALRPTGEEWIFIEATRSLAPADCADDPQAPLDGWSLPWHPLPASLMAAVSEIRPLPSTVTAARAECLRWEERLRHLDLLRDGPGEAALPTACAARRRMVDELWRRDLPVRTMDDITARLEYWTEKGEADGTGYAVLARDFQVLSGLLEAGRRGGSTRERALRLKAEHPDWSLARIGKDLGISRQAVHKHLKRG